MSARGQSRSRRSARRLRVGVVSLGCPKNLVDSEVMLGLLREDGCEIVREAGQADVVIVNTCGFIDPARRESIDSILEMAEWKKQRPGRRLVVAGCMGHRDGEELRRAIAEIDAVMGPGEVPQVVAAVRGTPAMLPPARVPTWLYDHAAPRVLATPAHMAYAKISDGCDYACAFCTIPQLRGRYRSRPEADVLAEARGLAARGVKELVLVAQDTSRYGLDRGKRDALADLLRKLGKVDGLRWIRVMYVHPTTLSDAVIDAIAEVPKVVKYVDVPLQHASPEVLRRMGRPAARRHVTGLVERLRQRIPGVVLRTSLIVGFPGETSQDFEDLLAFVRDAEFEHLGVFAFSKEAGTRAAGMPGQIQARVKAARLRRVMRLQQSISARALRRHVGRHAEVLVEAQAREGDVVLRGRTAGQAPEVDGVTLITGGRARIGDFVTCEVIGALDYDLIARIA